MRISVDATRCQGHSICLTIASELFDFDDDAGQAFARQDTLQNQDELAKRATESCPEQAIILVD